MLTHSYDSYMWTESQIGVSGWLLTVELNMLDTLEAINERAALLKSGERFEVRGLPSEIYHAADGYGSTAVREATRSMAHFWTYLHTPRTQSRDMLLGTLTHLLVFEPERVNDLIVVQPDDLVPGNNNAWKNWKAAQTKQIVTKAELEYSGDLASSVIDNLGQFFSDGYPELSVWYRDESSGLLLKARADYVQGDALIDLKTTRAESAGHFRSICGTEYAIQDALYRRVTGLADMVFAGVSKEAPYQCYLAKQGKEVRAVANNKLSAALDAIVFAQEFNSYPLPPVEVLETSLKPWD